MLATNFFINTTKETPKDAALASHQLMLRAGMLHKLAAGLYTWSPLGLKVLNKVANIIREELDKAGCLELLMPIIQPSELWQQTDRWDKFGPQLLKMQDRHQRDFCFGPTHEEVITDFALNNLNSYKQLPVCFYQIQTKFRDEIRPRFGVMRAREFLMKDAYSFHLGKACLADTYQKIYQVYCNIFERLELNFRAVLADTGAIGGEVSHEFHVLADSGEDSIAYTESGDYAANVELAQSYIAADLINKYSYSPERTCRELTIPTKELATTALPQDIISVEQQSAYLNITTKDILKTLLIKGQNNEIVALLLRGDDKLNEIKASKLGLPSPLQFLTPKEIEEKFNCAPGFLGPIGLKVDKIIADYNVFSMRNFVTGSNQTGIHYINLNFAENIAEPFAADLREVQAGDLAINGKDKLKICKGIEVGHIFQLGDTYSKAMQATVLNQTGKAVNPVMGCYGIGVSRVVAAAIEQKHDANGIIFPASIAPFQVAIMPINMKRSAAVTKFCTQLHQELSDIGVEVLLDNRDLRPGNMFSDLELLGIPHLITVGDKGLAENHVEYKDRATLKSSQIKTDNILEFIKNKVS